METMEGERLPQRQSGLQLRLLGALAVSECGELRPLHDDPFHAASALLGATVFYVSALASLLPAADFDPLAPAEVAAHKRGVLRTARHLLGTGAPRPAGGGTR